MNKNFKAGVVSVTFRQYAYKNFIKYTKLTDLSCVEWGSDIHIPYGDTVKAENVAAEMKQNNLETVSYGTYYRLGTNQKSQDTSEDIFPVILKTAEIIEAPSIRVWGGVVGSSLLDDKGRQSIIDDTLRIAALAKAANKDIALEYHVNTITDNIHSAVDFIQSVRNNGGNNVYLYWQPNQHMTFEENKAALERVCPYLSNIHVFAWEGTQKFPLVHHKIRWRKYIDVITNNMQSNGNADTAKHNFMLEFVKGDSVDQFVEDAATLIELLD